MARNGVRLDEVLFEFRRMGRAVRVVAIDPVSGTEVTMVGAYGYGIEHLKRVAARKLVYVMEKNAKAGKSGS